MLKEIERKRQKLKKYVVREALRGNIPFPLVDAIFELARLHHV